MQLEKVGIYSVFFGSTPTIDIEPEYIRSNYMGVRTADRIGLIKGYSWYDTETGKIGYATNGHPDVSADRSMPTQRKKDRSPRFPIFRG